MYDRVTFAQSVVVVEVIAAKGRVVRVGERDQRRRFGQRAVAGAAFDNGRRSEVAVEMSVAHRLGGVVAIDAVEFALAPHGDGIGMGLVIGSPFAREGGGVPRREGEEPQKINSSAEKAA